MAQPLPQPLNFLVLGMEQPLHKMQLHRELLFTRVTVLAWFESRLQISIRLRTDLVEQLTTSLSLKVLQRAHRLHRHLALTLWCRSKQLGCAHGLSRQQFPQFSISLLLVAAVVAVMQLVVVAPVDYSLITVAQL
jgi:hypothetical protein